MSKFCIITDTREKYPWLFEPDEYCEDSIVAKLDTGDYTIRGLEDHLCIERKRSVSEFAINITEARFIKFLNRMSEYAHAFILMEFGVNDILKFPIGSSIPSSKWKSIKITGKFMLRKISDIQVKHGIHVIPCEDTDNAQLMALNIMRRIYEKYSF